MSQLALAEHRHDILGALRALGGRATVGDVVAATGLGTADAEAGLKALLESHRGHLAVAESGELLYDFDARFIRRGTEPLLARLRRGAWRVFQQGFKVWIVVTLVVYFVVFVALVIAALVASQKGDGDRGGWGGRRGGHRGGLPVGDFFFWYWIWGPRWRLRRPYYGHRWERTLDKEDKVPFYKKVFAFVFGPDEPSPTRQQLDRSTLRLIRARAGVLSAAELVEHTALPRPEAESEMGRLVGSYDGEPVVTPDGEVVYAFPGVMMSAHGRVAAREPNPAWLRLEYPRDLTGNTAGANAAVVGINAFNLVAAATAPWFIFPRLGLGGTAAWIALVFVPVAFSLLFFAIPGLRMLWVARDNRRRSERNVRRVMLGLVYQAAVKGTWMDVESTHRHTTSRLKDQAVTRDQVERALHELAAEFDADVETAEDGVLRFRFPAVRDELRGAERVRRELELQGRSPGEIVFSTADSTEEAGRRELEAFDRALAGYVPATDRVGYEADYEVVAFDEELRSGRPARA